MSFSTYAYCFTVADNEEQAVNRISDWLKENSKLVFYDSFEVHNHDVQLVSELPEDFTNCMIAKTEAALKQYRKSINEAQKSQNRSAEWYAMHHAAQILNESLCFDMPW
jgi:hypothetical protein